jgi:hypothetical protein
MVHPENSVAEALSQAHVALLADLRELKQAVRPSSGEGLTELRLRLGAAQAHITEHFRFEEVNGYLGEVRKWEPRLDRAIEHLAEEHSQLKQYLETIIGEARVATSLGDPLREAIRECIERVRQHEIRENDLVQDAFNLDISAED